MSKKITCFPVVVFRCPLPVIMIVVALQTSLTAFGQRPSDVLENNGRQWMAFTDASNSLYHFLYKQAGGMLRERSDRIGALDSRQAWAHRQARARETLMDIVGPFPAKTPLQARITSRVDRDGYRVENILFQSQPGFYVTASLFLPDKAQKDAPAPAILYCSGHSAEGYRYPVYQHVIMNLVRKGFVVLAFDPVGQGERREYLDSTRPGFPLTSPTLEHSYPGALLFMTGRSLARCMIWDGIRAVDYLLTRPEVDPRRIGITGRSGGGTQSAYIAAFDTRITAAAPENYITSFSRLLEAIGPQDAEQNMPGALARGIDMADLLEVRAPRPTLMITTTRDMFPIQGALETFHEVKRMYEAYGMPERFSMVTDDAPHASTLKNREAMYAFFQKYLDNPGSAEDLKTTDLGPADLRVTRSGEVVTSLQAETVFSLNLKVARQKQVLLEEKRTHADYLPGALASARRLSGYRDPGETPPAVFTGRTEKNEYVVEKYFVKGEGDYVIPYLWMRPDKPNGKAILYLDPSGKAASAASDRVSRLLGQGFTVLAPDIIGIGELGPGVFKGDSYIGHSSYNLWYFSMLIGRSIVGIQAGDLVRLARLLKTTAGIQAVYGIALGSLSPAMLHAAAFDKAIDRVALIGPYISYGSMVNNNAYDPAFVASAVPGSIGVYDLPDLAAALAPRRLLVSAPTDGAGREADSASIREGLGIIRKGYRLKDAGSQLITDEDPDDHAGRYLSQWLR
jgi:dienelactone hydrolase